MYGPLDMVSLGGEKVRTDMYSIAELQIRAGQRAMCGKFATIWPNS